SRSRSEGTTPTPKKVFDASSSKFPAMPASDTIGVTRLRRGASTGSSRMSFTTRGESSIPNWAGAAPPDREDPQLDHRVGAGRRGAHGPWAADDSGHRSPT